MGKADNAWARCRRWLDGRTAAPLSLLPQTNEKKTHVRPVGDGRGPAAVGRGFGARQAGARRQRRGRPEGVHCCGKGAGWVTHAGIRSAGAVRVFFRLRGRPVATLFSPLPPPFFSSIPSRRFSLVPFSPLFYDKIKIHIDHQTLFGRPKKKYGKKRGMERRCSRGEKPVPLPPFH